jgi:hypothetical protein
VCSKFLALNGADLHGVKTVHPVRRALFVYGFWHALVASLENVFEFSAILSVISVSKQLDAASRAPKLPQAGGWLELLQANARREYWKGDYFFAPRIASFAALATRNLTTVLAGILIFC